ncbi:MerR family transcriptional regulator [Nocardioides sp. B-3]|uniref:MerR family transcriptional regulator n=1 Tax=Nocardioides sp. B-3 TaxID=2895565 RepID=UPI00215244FA|nr:MerR family transcriptional regulator [Nocardioides sp. B-3]UUZ59888.1 MerR family transcriptional regulator [Nocardioides sp. B-3]
MENELLGIGRLASLSGLPVSALRFYDGAEVLRPCMVDPSTGYRFYQPSRVVQARLISHLRRVGLSLDDIRTVLTEPADAAPIPATHLSRLEAGPADARREISIVHQLLENTEITMTRCTLPAAELIRALREVRYAISNDPDAPTLNGVFSGQRTRQVARRCDRPAPIGHQHSGHFRAMRASPSAADSGGRRTPRQRPGWHPRHCC